MTTSVSAVVRSCAPDRDTWREIVTPYESPCLRRSLWDVATSVVPYVTLCAAMYLLLQWSAPLALLLIVPAAGFLLRTFIVFHDCAHTSLFRSRRANDTVGRLCAILVFTPFSQWRHEHAVHHASNGNLDKRGSGDITTLTVNEYRALDRSARARYRIYRNPFVLFVIGGLFFHLVQQRFAGADARPRDRHSVHMTSVALAAMVAGLMVVFSPWAVLQIQLPVLALAGTIGIWMFYVQHQFEDAYWADTGTWHYATAALHGSSYLKLHPVLQWFTGNIGVHHVHHLSSRIPNYRLQQCHDENPLLQDVPTLGFRAAMRTINLKLWDEESQRLVGWRHPSLARA